MIGILSLTGCLSTNSPNSGIQDVSKGTDASINGLNRENSYRNCSGNEQYAPAYPPEMDVPDDVELTTKILDCVLPARESKSVDLPCSNRQTYGLQIYTPNFKAISGKFQNSDTLIWYKGDALRVKVGLKTSDGKNVFTVINNGNEDIPVQVWFHLQN